MSKIIFNELQCHVLKENPKVASIFGWLSFPESNLTNLSTIVHEILKTSNFN